jgi:hypothetical protein
MAQLSRDREANSDLSVPRLNGSQRTKLPQLIPPPAVAGNATGTTRPTQPNKRRQISRILSVAVRCGRWCGSVDAVGKVDDHRAALRCVLDWLPYLAANSGLPGPRGNLELVAACAEEADLIQAERLIDTGDEFATVCGLVALGRLLGQGDGRQGEVLHRYATDDRWRVREGVAMALQRAGDDDPDTAFTIAEAWATDTDPLVRRAAVAAVCEPRLLCDPAFARRTLDLLARVTGELARSPLADGRASALRTLRQALGYGWSVAVAALPDEGLAKFARFAASDDPDVAWIVLENRKKNRLKRLLDH